MTVGTVEAILSLRDEMSAKLDAVRGKMDSFSGGVKTAIGVAAGAFAALDVVGAANRVINSTSQIADAAAQIGVSAEAVQRLGFAAEQSGGSLDGVAVAMGQMAKNLESGGKDIAALGLSLETLREQTPDQMFLAITEAIRQMPDPIQQSAAAMNVFGRGGTQLLPAIRAGFAEIGDQAPVMSSAIVSAGDEAGDKLALMRQRMDNLKAEALIPLIDTFLSLPDSVQTGVAGIAAFMPSMHTLVLGIMGAGGPVAAFTALKVGALAVATFFSGAMTSAVSALLPWLGPAGWIVLGVTAIYVAWKKWDVIEATVKAVYTAVATWLGDKFTAIVDNVKGKIKAVTDAFKWMADKVALNSYVPDMIGVIAQQFGRLPSVMQGPTTTATTAVTKLFEGMLSKLTAKITGSEGVTTKIAGLFGSSGVGKALGTGLSAALPLVGSLVGPAISGLKKLFGGLFGGGEGKEVKKLRGQFEEAAGGASVLRAQAEEAGISLAKLYSTKKVKDFQAEAQRVSEQLKTFASEQAADAERLTKAIQTYGFSFAELGPKLQQQNLHAQAQELIEDWRVLAAAGIDISTINARMGSTVSDYLQTAIQVGAEIPSAMRPILQSMIDQGALVDANGVAITDLASTGVTFSETMTQGFQRIVEKLDELIARLQGAGAAIGNIPRSVDVAVNYQMPDLGSIPTSAPFEMPSFAGGTHGQFVDFGAGTPAMLHGKERVVTEREASSGGDASGLAASIAEIGRMLSTQPMAIRDAILLTR